MLKIKDNVDLEILKEYGFKLAEECRIPAAYFEYEIVDCYIKGIGIENGVDFYIKADYTREITTSIKELDTLYDLIKADLEGQIKAYSGMFTILDEMEEEVK